MILPWQLVKLAPSDTVGASPQGAGCHISLTLPKVCGVFSHRAQVKRGNQELRQWSLLLLESLGLPGQTFRGFLCLALGSLSDGLHLLGEHWHPVWWDTIEITHICVHKHTV